MKHHIILEGMKRHSYWIVYRKSAVRNILQKFTHYKRMRLQQRTPIMAEVPDERIGLYKSALSYTGIDSWLLNILNVQEQHRLGLNVVGF